MLFLLGRRSRTNDNLIRFLTDGSACGRRSMTPLSFDTQAEAEAEVANHTPGKYFVVPVPTLAKVDGRMESVAANISAAVLGGAVTRKRPARKTTPSDVYETYRGYAIRRTANGYRSGKLIAKTRDGIRDLIRHTKGFGAASR